MKLPRWLMIGMLTSSVLAVLAAAGLWWVTWPERTAREYIALMAEEKFDATRAMTTSETWYELNSILGKKLTQSNLERGARRSSDLILGRQCFRISNAGTVLKSHEPPASIDFRFTVERGRVINQSFD